MALLISIDGQTIIASPTEFTSGSDGYNFTGKVLLDGVAYQVGGNITRIGSSKEPEAPARAARAIAAQKAKAALKQAVEQAKAKAKK